MVLGGPLLSLSLWGSVLPCLEKEEDCQARQALVFIQKHCKCIEWNTDQPTNSSKGGFAFVSNLFGSKDNSRHGGGSNNSTGSGASCFNSRSRIRIRDGDIHPVIVLEPASNPDEESDSNLDADPLEIPLGRVDRVTGDPNSGLITLTAKKWDRSTPPAVLLNFMVWKSGDVPLPDTDRNLLVHHWLVLVEWERQRRAVLGDDYDESDEGGNFLQARARKAKHFAAREVELQQTKRDREARKAKLMSSGGGGMKYTAIAMANRG